MHYCSTGVFLIGLILGGRVNHAERLNGSEEVDMDTGWCSERCPGEMVGPVYCDSDPRHVASCQANEDDTHKDMRCRSKFDVEGMLPVFIYKVQNKGEVGYIDMKSVILPVWYAIYVQGTAPTFGDHVQKPVQGLRTLRQEAWDAFRGLTRGGEVDLALSVSYGISYLLGHQAATAMIGEVMLTYGTLSTFILSPAIAGLNYIWDTQKQMEESFTASNRVNILLSKRAALDPLRDVSRYHWKELKPKVQHACGDEGRGAMADSIKMAMLALHDMLLPLAQLGYCLFLEFKCVQHMWPALGMGPLPAIFALATQYATIAGTHYTLSFDGWVSNVLLQKNPDSKPINKDPVEAADDGLMWCKRTVLSNNFWQQLFEKFQEIIDTWIRTFLRDWCMNAMEITSVYIPSAQRTCKNIIAGTGVDRMCAKEVPSFARPPRDTYLWGRKALWAFK